MQLSCWWSKMARWGREGRFVPGKVGSSCSSLLKPDQNPGMKLSRHLGRTPRCGHQPQRSSYSPLVKLCQGTINALNPMKSGRWERTRQLPPQIAGFVHLPLLSLHKRYNRSTHVRFQATVFDKSRPRAGCLSAALAHSTWPWHN